MKLLEILPQQTLGAVADELKATVALDALAFPTALLVFAAKFRASLQLGSVWSNDSEPSPSLDALVLICVLWPVNAKTGAGLAPIGSTCVFN